MLIEFSIFPIGTHEHISGDIAKALQIVDDSGLPYQLTPSGTCIEGEWDEVMPVIKRCHEILREQSPHVVTMVKVEDDGERRGKLSRNVESVEEKVGHSLRREHSNRVVVGAK
jgi:uncharacterized protein (TIGR00106 family)